MGRFGWRRSEGLRPAAARPGRAAFTQRRSCASNSASAGPRRARAATGPRGGGSAASAAATPPVTVPTLSMNFDSRVPFMKAALSPPSSTPANRDCLNASTPRMPSSMLSWATRLITCTPRRWPMRCTRPMRCASLAGFCGRPLLTTVAACMPQVQTHPASIGGQKQPALRIVDKPVHPLGFCDSTAALRRRSKMGFARWHRCGRDPW